MSNPSTGVIVAALYRFVKFPDFESFRDPLLQLMLSQGVRGTLLLASEGINGTIAGPRLGVDAVIDWLMQDERLRHMETKESFAQVNPFYRSKVKLKKEIVTKDALISSLNAVKTIVLDQVQKMLTEKKSGNVALAFNSPTALQRASPGRILPSLRRSRSRPGGCG